MCHFAKFLTKNRYIGFLASGYVFCEAIEEFPFARVHRRIVLCIDTGREPDSAKGAFDSHLARANG